MRLRSWRQAYILGRMSRRKLFNLAVALIGLVSALLAVRSLPHNAAVVADGRVRVTHVSDGDTFRATGPDGEFTVRILGIDTPETVKPNAPVDCYGPEASTRTKEVLDGAQVTLTADPSQDNRDRYGRYLRYVALADGSDYGESLVREGYAREYTFHKPGAHALEYRAAEDEAHSAGRGLWGVCPGAAKKKRAH